MSFALHPNLVREHLSWLKGHDAQHLRNWQRILASDAEAAGCEARVRLLLAENGSEVEPNEELTGQSMAPDFRCRRRGQIFYVEATCIGIEKATETTRLRHPLTPWPSAYRPLNDAIFKACRQKTPQCAGQAYPCLLAIGTFHAEASCVCVRRRYVENLLTGEPLIAHDIDTRTGEPVGETHEITRLRSAAFIRPGGREAMAHARSPISGMLICGFGRDPPNVFGVLHPSPVREFDRQLLPEIEFCRLKEGYESGKLSTEWI